jgi:hypothetical protein
VINATTVAREKAAAVKCIITEYSDVFEIPIEELLPDEEFHSVAVDLIAPGGVALIGSGKQVVLQKCFKDAVPWILATLWRGSAA